jgi:hypothetical protein
MCPELICRDQSLILKLGLATVFLNKKIKIDLEQELNIPPQESNCYCIDFFSELEVMESGALSIS